MERRMVVERLWYEGSPYLYAATGMLSALDARGSLLMQGSASLLCCAALTIIAFRWIHRRDSMPTGALPIDESRYLPIITQDVFARERRKG
ncbi:MAG TPA: hypothetical protein VH560_14325 [Polyangia bacterium]|nr:hypothetical protein [Polyangia bacterium]